MTDRELLETKILALEAEIKTQLRADARAVEVALNRLDKRLEGEPFADRERTDERFAVIEGQQAESRGRAAVFGSLGGVAVSVIITVLAEWLLRRGLP